MSTFAEQHVAMLTEICSEERVLYELPDRRNYSSDASIGVFLPDVVVQPITTQEVSAIIKLANQELIPVTPRGLSTCLSGGPLPVKGGIVLDMSLMNQKLIIDERDLVAIVSPGVLTADIHHAAEQKGLMYPPDPSSSPICTIGGNLAENSGGPRGLKYGVTKDYVIGLEVVTPQGEIIRTGGRTVKNVTGYDLTKLIVGSEGTLGVITEAVLRLIPKPVASVTLMAIFDDLIDCGKAITQVLTSRILPAKIELMDQASIEAVENDQPMGLPRDAKALILIELDGHPGAIAGEIKEVEEICLRMKAKEVKTAIDVSEQDELWKARRNVSQAVAKIKPAKISEDITVPRSKIPEALERLQQIKHKYHLPLVVFGHAGDGNLHPNILADPHDEEEMKRVEQASADIFRLSIELGGTLSGEHGIGLLKSTFMELETGPIALGMMRQIKAAWDPNDIMNPGKIFVP